MVSSNKSKRSASFSSPFRSRWLFSTLFFVGRPAPGGSGGPVVAIGLSAFGAFISPVFVEPLFNTYKPLTDPAIRDPILAMARANQIPVDQVFVVDASRQTTRVSANVAGFLGTTRIALNDNLLKQCTLPEIREVMAHEMGHYVLNHGMKLVQLAVLIFFCFLVHAARFQIGRSNNGAQRWDVRGIDDPAGLPLLVLDS